MEDVSSEVRGRVLLGRPALIGLAITLASMVILGAWPWLQLAVGGLSTPGAALRLLGLLRVAYFSILIIGAAGLAYFARRHRRARRRGLSRAGTLRGLAASSACLLGLAAVETASAAWLAWSGFSRARSMAATGLDRDFPLPSDFPETAGPDELNLVVLGESSAVGFPCHEWLSLGRILDWQLGKAFPGRRVRVEILAHEGDTLELQHRRLSQLRRRPDAVIVYCGHNEFAARYPPLRNVDHYQDQRPAPSDRAIGQGLGRLSPFARLLDRIAERYQVGIRPASNDRRSLVDVPVYSEVERAERLTDFRGRLERIVEYCRKVGALAVLLIPPGNDADFEPNRSFLSARTDPQEREAFARRFEEIRSLEGTDPSRALSGYQAFLAEQPGFAEAHFRLARLLRKEGRSDEAYEHFRAARDLDGLPIRCPTELQDAYRGVARGPEAVLVDGQELFHSLGKQGQLDDVLFHDAMHPSVRGHVALAEAVLRALQARRAFGWAADAPPIALDPAAVAEHFGIDNSVWELLSGRAAMFYFGFLGARYEAAERLAKQELYQEAARRIAKGEAPASLGLPNIGFASDNRTTSRRP